MNYRLDADPLQVSSAREQARKALPGWGLGEHTDVAELVVSELVTNAIVHGAGISRCACRVPPNVTYGPKYTTTAPAGQFASARPPMTKAAGVWS